MGEQPVRGDKLEGSSEGTDWSWMGRIRSDLI